MSNEISLWIKKLAVTAIMVAIGYGIYLTSNTIIMLGVAGFLTILITPLVEKWRKFHIPEWITIVVVYIAIILLATIVAVSIVPIVIDYFASIIRQVTHWANTAQDTYLHYGIRGFNLPDWLENAILYVVSPENINNTLDLIKQNAGSIQTFLTSQISSITSGGISIVSTIGNMFTDVLFIGIATFFMVLERKSIGQIFLDVTPDDKEDHIRYLFSRVQEVCISWIKASIILSFSIFLFTYIGLYIAEIIFHFSTERVFTLALISGIMEFVPYIGPILSVIPALIIALGISWEASLVILILYVIIQQAENNILVPYIMSKNLDISPLFVFVIMLFGATLGGIIGIIVAVPIAGVLKVLYTDWIDQKKQRGRYALHNENNISETLAPNPLEAGKNLFKNTKKYLAKAKNFITPKK